MMSTRIIIILAVLGNYFLSDSHLKGDVTITSTPSAIPSTPSGIVYAAVTNSNDSQCNGRVVSNRTPLWTLCELTGRFTITNTSGPGVLNISWYGWVSTSKSYSPGPEGNGYPGTTYDVDQVIRFGSTDGPMTTIATLGDDVIRIKDGNPGFNFAEQIFIGGLPGRYFSVDCPIVNGIYNLDCVLRIYNSTGGAAMENITLSFARTTSLKSVVIVPATPQRPATICGSVSGGSPNGTAHLEASIDLGRTDPWQAISTITLDASGNGSFISVQDTRPAAINARSDFFRVSVEP